MTQRYATCRALGHAWDLIEDDNRFSDANVVLGCRRCPSRRYDTVKSDGSVSKRRYYYPPGYKYPRNQSPTRDQFRLILLERYDAR